MPKKHHIILLILVSDLVLFAIFLIAWIWFRGNDANVHFLIMAFSYLLPLILLTPFILRNKGLSMLHKWKWLAYILTASFIGCFHFYIRYKNEIDHFARETDEKMKDGPRSLSEFNSSANR